MPKPFEVVLIPFPFTDLTGDKVRPAIVLSHYKDDVVVLFISSKKHKDIFTLEIKNSEFNGLKTLSFVCCTKIATLHKKLIIGGLGSLEEFYVKDIRLKLKNFLNI
jgi:mRNA interferase MazF